MFKIISNFRNPETDPYLIFLQEKYKKYPFTFWYDKFPDSGEQLSINPYNFLFLHEPNEFFGYHNIAISTYNLFSGIFTWNNDVLSNISNGILFTYNGATLDLDFIKQMENKEKEFEVSFLCGTKKLVEGHTLRHKVYDLKNNKIGRASCRERV